MEVVTQQGTPEQQKQFLGEQLYAQVVQTDATLAGQIVGMILEAYSFEQMVENANNPQLLAQTIEKAQQTIAEHQRAQQPPAQ